MNCKRAETLGRVKVKEREDEEREKNFRQTEEPIFLLFPVFLSGYKIREGGHGIMNINKELSLA